jgi:cell division septum initiation protein DivIVA
MMGKHISVIAEDYLQQVQDLRKENAQLRQQLKDTAKSLAKCEADDVKNDDDSQTDAILPVLNGAR